MTIYYAGPEDLAAPRLRPGVLGDDARTLWHCASHHLLAKDPAGANPRVLLCNPLRGPLVSTTARDGGSGRAPAGRPAEGPNERPPLVEQLLSHLRDTTHPSWAGHAALVVNEPRLLPGSKSGPDTLFLCKSLASYIRLAEAIGVACYISVERPNILPTALRRALRDATLWEAASSETPPDITPRPREIPHPAAPVAAFLERRTA